MRFYGILCVGNNLKSFRLIFVNYQSSMMRFDKAQIELIEGVAGQKLCANSIRRVLLKIYVIDVAECEQVK